MYKRQIEEVGLIEPLVVHPQAAEGPPYLLLDGNIRLDILRRMGHNEVLCLVATDDDSFTYNHKVNQVSAIQEHFMIMRAIEAGVSEERIATALAIDVKAIRAKRDLLAGICPEAVKLLKERNIHSSALRELKRVTAIRQIEMAELMIAANNYSNNYARHLYLATPEEQCLASEQPRNGNGVSPEDAARLRMETEKVTREFKTLERTHGETVLQLTVAAAYLRKLLENPRVMRYLSQHHREVLEEFQRIVEVPDLAQPAGAAAEETGV